MFDLSFDVRRYARHQLRIAQSDGYDVRRFRRHVDCPGIDIQDGEWHCHTHDVFNQEWQRA